MLTLDEGVLKENAVFLFKYHVKVYDFGHASDRLKERHPDLTLPEFYASIKNGLDRIDDIYSLDPDFYMINSKHSDLKFPIEIRPDRKSGESIAVISTVLHKKYHRFNTRGEKDIFVESKFYDQAIQELLHSTKNSYYILDEFEESVGYQLIFDSGVLIKTYKDIWI